MSSNELYKQTFSQDFTLAAGTANVDLYGKSYFPNTSKFVGLVLKTAGAAGADNNDPAKLNVNVVVTPGLATANPTYICTVKNNLVNTDVGVYTLSWVNEVKNGLYPC
jgi:hypothetical protein